MLEESTAVVVHRSSQQKLLLSCEVLLFTFIIVYSYYALSTINFRSLSIIIPVSYTHLTLPTIYSV